MGSFELIEHAADVGVVATGDTLAEALAWVAKGVFSVIADMERVAPRSLQEFSVTSSDRNALVVDWLNELLRRYETEGFLARDFLVAVDETETRLSARCLGEPFDPLHHDLLAPIRAATHNDLTVTHDGEWRIQVVLDM
ncbi:MAG: archease [Candidatus Brocadiia bacterium]|nr:archease [Candidatus Brocadiia bacterium]